MPARVDPYTRMIEKSNVIEIVYSFFLSSFFSFLKYNQNGGKFERHPTGSCNKKSGSHTEREREARGRRADKSARLKSETLWERRAIKN